MTGINAMLLPGGSISGVVLGGTPRVRPQGAVCIEAVPTARNRFGGSGATSPSGRYIVRGLTPGVYQVFFDPNCLVNVSTQVGQWYKNQPAQRRAAPVRVRVGRTHTGIDARLANDGSISGRVTGPSSTALTGACVTAVSLAAGARAVTAVTEKGGYALVDMPPGRYRVRFSSGCGSTGLATQWWRDAPTKAEATVITVKAGTDTGGISAALRS